MRVLVTGGTGYLGSAIVRSVVRHGHQPIVFARHATASGLPGTLIDGDVRDPDAVRAAATGADAICHSAALVATWRRRREDFVDVNVGGLRHVLDACRDSEIRRVVYTSSFLALSPAGEKAPLAANDYQRSKTIAHRLARDAADRGLPVISMIPGVLFGPGPATEANLVGRLVRDHLAGRLPGIIGAQRTWSFAWIDHVADAHVAAIEEGQPGAEYALGGENCAQIRVFEIVRDLTGHALPRRLPVPVAYAAATIEELRAVWGRHQPRLTRQDVRILGCDWPLDSARSIKELSFRITDLKTGLATVLAAR